MPSFYPENDTVLWSHHTAAANTQVVATITPPTNGYVCIDHVILSYSGGTPAAATLIITDGTNTISVDTNSVGPHDFELKVPFVGVGGATVTVTASAAGAGVIAKLNVGRRP